MNEHIKTLVSKPLVTLSIGGVAGLVVGGGSTYLILKKKLANEYELVRTLQDALSSERETFNETTREAAGIVKELREMGVSISTNLTDLRSGEEPKVVVEQIVQPTEEALENETFVVEVQEHYTVDVDVVVEEEDDTVDVSPVTRNIFSAANDGWDWDEEKKNRSSDQPYILHVDEYSADENDWDSQTTLTWYAGDEILTDDKDVPIYNPRTVVGDLKFGHGSGDPSVCYVRNERLKAEYEVLLDPNSYAVVILGLDDDIEEKYERADLKHSKTPLRFRSD